MRIIKTVIDEIRFIANKMQQTEKNKKTSVERHRAFLEERRVNSSVQKRIEDTRTSIQHKRQSDQ